MPERIQLSRRKGFRLPPNTVKVDRSTDFGNPFKIHRGTTTLPGGGTGPCWLIDTLDKSHAWLPKSEAEAVEISVRAFEAWLASPHGVAKRLQVINRLHGKNLACWCKAGSACHADVLLRIANSTEGT